MSGERPSERQLKAREAQSKADRKGTGKDAASKLQSEADYKDVTKH